MGGARGGAMQRGKNRSDDINPLIGKVSERLAVLDQELTFVP